MRFYSSFEEKSKYFNHGGVKIDNDKDFNHYSHLLMFQYSKVDFIFRGLSEAKFKLFNSAQREWDKVSHENNDYDNYIVNLIQKCKDWNNGTIKKILSTYDISENNSLAYLAFMQHFGIPTPLIDFTKNPNNALFFAVNDINYTSDSTNEIDNYFSIYFSYQSNNAYDVFYDTFLKNRKEEPHGEFDYGNLSLNGLILVSDRVDEHKILNNIRIANQEGLFFFNSSPTEPIEFVYKGFSDLLLKTVGEIEFKKLLVHDTFAGCFNIHKKYASHIKKILVDMGITSDYIYPNIDNLKDYCK